MHVCMRARASRQATFHLHAMGMFEAKVKEAWWPARPSIVRVCL